MMALQYFPRQPTSAVLHYISICTNAVLSYLMIWVQISLYYSQRYSNEVFYGIAKLVKWNRHCVICRKQNMPNIKAEYEHVFTFINKFK